MPCAERPIERGLLRAGAVIVWLATAVVSLIELDGQAAALLQQAGWSDPFWIRAVVIAGAGVDAVLGVWLAVRPGRVVYGLALATMALMTLAATVLLPALWLHPLGPLTKNIPIAVCLWLLLCEENRR